MSDSAVDRFLRQRLARRRLLVIGGAAGAALALSACGARGGAGTNSDSADASVGNVARPRGWSDESHSNGAAPSYDIVFPADRVNTLSITLSPENWTAMLANMTELYGERGTESTQGGPAWSNQAKG